MRKRCTDMRSCKRNQTRIYYANLIREDPEKDENGRFTGNNISVYSIPQPFYISVSANKGDISPNKFGNLTDYDKTLSVTDTDCPIDENSRLWIYASITQPHDFEVKKKSVSLNETVYAVKQVTVQ